MRRRDTTGVRRMTGLGLRAHESGSDCLDDNQLSLLWLHRLLFPPRDHLNAG